jgi:hypothetical protein
MAKRRRKPAASGGSRSRVDRPWKDETNPTAARAAEERETDDAEQTPGASPGPDQSQPVSPRRAQAGREDQGLSWQTGPGSGGATQSSGRVKEHEARSNPAGPKR